MTLTALINTASATHTTRFAAQQNDGERVLVAHKVWMTRYGVATPVTTTNL